MLDGAALMGALYLAALVFSLAGMVAIDRRFRLFFWAAPARAAIVTAAGVVFFLVWDLVGIGFGVFFRGSGEFMTGLLLAPELPIEEVFFLTLLCWVTMLAYTGAVRMLATRGDDGRDARDTDAGAGRDGGRP